MFLPVILQPARFVSKTALALVFGGVLVCGAGAASAQSAFDDPNTRVAGGTGDMAAVENKIDAGDVALGSSSQAVILFRNDDTKPLRLGEINLYPSSNVSASVSQNQCVSEPLAPQAVCAVAFSIKGLQSGRFRIEILAKHDGTSRLLTATISGNVDAGSNTEGQRNTDLEVVPDKIDYGTLTAGGTQVKSVLMRNITSQPITVEDVSIQSNPRSGLSLNHTCDELESGGACVVSVTWAPEQIGPTSGSVVVKHTGPTGMSNIEITGNYTPAAPTEAAVFSEAVPGKGLLVSSMSEVNFGTGIEKSSSITVSLVNTGDAPLTLTGLGLSNTENGLVLEKSGCVRGRVLNPIEACPLTVTWSPVRAGNIIDDVQVAHTGARGILVLPVRGAATAAVSKDSQAIALGSFGAIPRLSLSDVADAADDAAPPARTARGKASSSSLSDYTVGDVRGVLDGYRITSLSANRAIISGPGGSRVVMDGENTVIGGVPWVIAVKPGAVQFTHSGQTIVLLFDKSLSFINQNTSQSMGGSGNPGAGAAPSAPAPVPAP